jgi:thiol-disulfide isomerase/thioredoxin
MRRSLGVALLLVAGQVVSVSAERPSGSELTPAEQELVALMTDYYGALEIYWSARREYETIEAYQKAIAEGDLVDPNAEYIPRLLAFEAEHPGEDVGLLALWHVFREAARGGMIDSPTNVGRREAATRLGAYAESELLLIVVRVAMSGRYEPAVYEAVTELVSTPAGSRAIRDILRYRVATDSLETRDGRNWQAKRLEALRSGAEPRWSGELDYMMAWFDMFPSAEDLEERCNSAIRTLEELAIDEASPRLPGVKGADERWYVVRIIDDAKQPRLAEKAAALLFKERHLKVGARAPDLEVTLLNGAAWRMADQIGKVVVIQFSFTGCGPCERMYPELAKLAAEFGERVAILTLMRDETSESALEAVASGKITWHVALDGKPGRVATQWSVSGFPETYVIDSHGNITAHGLRGEALREEVARLLGAGG